MLVITGIFFLISEHRNEIRSPTNSGKFPDRLSEYQLLKKGNSWIFIMPPI
jgi:hypothetical protein